VRVRNSSLWSSIDVALACSLILLCVEADRALGQGPEWGTVKGQLVWGGAELPPQKNANVNKDEQHCLSKGAIPDESWVINKANKGIRWAFVWLAPEPGQPRLPVHGDLQLVKNKEVTIDQPCCRFEPHALALREGQELIVKNSAPVAHNVNWSGVSLKNAGGNVIVPAGKSFSIKGLAADKFPVKIACNIHQWMSGWVRIFDNPYYAVTDADGNFEIKLAPAGKCRIFVWQESVGYRGGAAGRNGSTIDIKPGGVTELGKLDIKP
jgi:hypothetical protein